MIDHPGGGGKVTQARQTPSSHSEAEQGNCAMLAQEPTCGVGTWRQLYTVTQTWAADRGEKARITLVESDRQEALAGIGLLIGVGQGWEFRVVSPTTRLPPKGEKRRELRP